MKLKRGYSREVAELAEIAGMLHDLLTYVDRSEDTDDHAHKCADQYSDNEEKKIIRDNVVVKMKDERTIDTVYKWVREE